MIETGALSFTWKRHERTLLFIILLALIAEMGLALLDSREIRYEMQGEVSAAFPQENVTCYGGSLEDGWLRVSSSYAALELDTSGLGEICTVLLTLSEPAERPFAIRLFYNIGTDSGFPYSLLYSVPAYWMGGETQLTIEIPRGAYKSLRLEIPVSIPLLSIDCTPLWAEAVDAAGSIRFLPLRALTIALLFALAAGAANVMRLRERVDAGIRVACAAPFRYLQAAALLILGAAMGAAALYFALQAVGLEGGYRLKSFCMAAAMLGAICLSLRKRVGRQPEIVFLLILLTAGTLFIRYLPAGPDNSWDEAYHLQSAMEMSCAFASPSLASPAKLWAAPSGLLMHFAHLLRADELTLLRLGRLGNLLLYAIIGYFAIRRLSCGKLLLSVLLLLPTNLFLACSYSYDPILTACTALAFSCFFEEWRTPDKPMRPKDALVMIGALVIGVQCKPIYVAILPIMLCVPKRKFPSARARWIYRAAVLGATLLVFMSFLLPFFMDMGSMTDSRGGADVNAGEQTLYILTHPLAYTRTLLGFLCSYLSPENSAGYIVAMGHRSASPYHALCLMLLAAAAFTDWDGKRSFRGHVGAVAFCGFMLFGTVCLFATSMYISYTGVGSPTIMGCQPRYLLPLLFPILYLAGNGVTRCEVKRGGYNAVVLALAGYAALGTVLGNVIV